MSTKSLAAFIICILLIGSASAIITLSINESNVDKNDKKGDNKLPPLGEISSFNDAINAFSFDIYKKFFNDSENQGNIFTSPYSIFVALAMTYEGAEGITAEEMRDVLNIDQDNESFHEYMKALYEYLNYNDEYNISTANALWIRENYPILEEYKELISTYYGGKSTEMDFSDREKAAETINEWIESKTNNLIKDLILPAHISPATALILTNAIYFKGTWEVQFEEDATIDRSFTLPNGEKLDVETMTMLGKEDEFNYTENEVMQILELPYEGNDISMTIFLPKEGSDVSDIISTLDHDSYSELINSMSRKEADIYLPKFTIKTPLYDLNKYLEELGMPSAFGSGADFSGMTGFKSLYISKVLHKAFIEVNEEGTEAAAATAVIMNESCTSVGPEPNPRIVFDADHPFVFTINHKETGAILFMGSVDNPSQ